MGTLLMSRLQDEFPDKMFLNFSVFPSLKTSDITLDPYNTILSCNYFTQNSNEVITFDNEALLNICERTLK